MTITGGEPGERLADRVYGQLLEFMVEQNLDQGDRLPSEHELSRMTGVSRPIVREALTRLQADGLIESRRGAGSFLRQRPAERQIQHLRPVGVRARLDAFEVRIALEPPAAGQAALNRTEDELQAMRAALDALSAAHGAAESGAAHDLRLHRTIAQAARNPLFLVSLDALNQCVDGLIVPSLSLLADGAQLRAYRVEREHLAVFEAIQHGDADCAEAAMRLHLMNARARALRMRW